MQTQAMLDHMLETDCKEPKGVKLPSKNSAKKRPPKRSPNHKRIRINEDLQRAEKMQVEPQVENDVKAKLDPFDPKSVEAFEKQWRPPPSAKSDLAQAKLELMKKVKKIRQGIEK